ncbi:LexA family protein [Oceanospirillum sediminis]|uniref:Helix-turn-helix domain-containing protein n=1 Tax=Oceanospirillum sediminis TaxID=2760088 RepID=A0A839INE7_9GAMM|nr:S24 family peptidase [Oceanospirillum sediminis]MBB1485806.1 helix-turn-helix domain-containing protein [Oceanospirillum sediminis]
MLGERLKKFRKDAGMTQQQVADLMGVSRPAVGQWESGQTSPSLEMLSTLAARYGVSRGVLLGDEPENSSESNIAPAPKMAGMAPLISWVQAGMWSESFVEINEDTEFYPRPAGASANTFVLRVVGESMIDEYKPGTLIFVDPERAAKSGDDVIASLIDSGEATFKRYIEEPGTGKFLKALNSAWAEPYLQINGSCRILGVIVADMRIRL